MKNLFILVFISVIGTEVIARGHEVKVVDEFDEDDDIDPYEDDGEHIDYPVKSVMPERAMPKDDTKILPHEGSGAPLQSMLNVN